VTSFQRDVVAVSKKRTILIVVVTLLSITRPIGETDWGEWPKCLECTSVLKKRVLCSIVKCISAQAGTCGLYKLLAVKPLL
jgi:hypothetical protein